MKFVNRKRARFLFSSSLCLITGLTVLTSTASAAPSVKGNEGCVMGEGNNGSKTERIPGPGGSETKSYQQSCKKGMTGEGMVPVGPNMMEDKGDWIYGNFVSADEVNDAFDQMEKNYKEYVQEKIKESAYDGAKDAEQDDRLNGHDSSITNINQNINNINKKNDQQDAQLNDHEDRITKNENDIVDIKNKNDQQDTTLNDHEERITRNEGDIVDIKKKNDQQDQDIAGIQDGAVFYNRDENGKKTGGVKFDDGTGNPVKLTNVAEGTEDTDGVNYGQIKDNLSYDRNSDGSRSNSITLVGGADGPVGIHNLADGKVDSDAATVRQVRQARQESFDYTDQEVAALRDTNNHRFEALTGELSKTRKEARAGIAGAMAAAGLRYDDRPGKGSLAAGFGGFKGASAFAAGVGYTTEDGRFRLNSGISHSFSDRATGWNAAASWTFN